MMEIFDCEQSSDEWRRARLGIPTASEFHTVMARGKDGGASITRRTYMMKLAGEQMTGEPMENYSNGYMERGKALEDEARQLYAFTRAANLTRVGFIRNGQKGASPDSLIDTAGMLEIKTKAPHLLIEVLLKDEFPPEHKAQCYGALWVAEREYIDIAIFYPRMPLFVKRAHRDEKYIVNLSAEVDRFNDELSALVNRIHRRGEEFSAPEFIDPVERELNKALGADADQQERLVGTFG